MFRNIQELESFEGHEELMKPDKNKKSNSVNYALVFLSMVAVSVVMIISSWNQIDRLDSENLILKADVKILKSDLNFYKSLMPDNVK